MVAKTMAVLKKLTALGVILLGFLVVLEWEARADSSNPYRVTASQNKTRTTNGEKSTPSPEVEESESSTEEKKESTSAKKKPLKDFQPSERIEAEQAVDFPYDI